MGKHRRIPRVARVATPARVSPRPVGITDAQTRVQHLMSDESAMAHRHSGHYLALCGERVLAASLTARERSHCQRCLTVS